MGLIRIFLAIETEVYRQEEALNLLAQVQFITDNISRDLYQANDPLCLKHSLGKKPVLCVWKKGHWQSLPVRYFMRHHKLYRKLGDHPAQELARGLVKMKMTSIMRKKQMMGLCFWFVLRSQHFLWVQKRYYYDGKYFLIHDGRNYISWPIVIAFRELNS